MEASTTYTNAAVAAILSRFEANTSDYILYTIFRIFKITEGPLYEKYKRRFSNIIFNNRDVISEQLTVSFLCNEARRSLIQDLSRIKYVSCLYPNTNHQRRPVLLRYFHRDRGVEHRVLTFTPETELVATLQSHGITEKLVSFCGDYCYKDAAKVGSTGGCVGSLQVLSPNFKFHLPYGNGFVDRLFDVLLDYLPGDVTKSVLRLGQTLSGLSGHSNLAKELIAKYKEWSKSDGHILASDYVRFVIANYDSIHSYLEPYLRLPKCVGSFFSRVDQRFLLSFMHEMYLEVKDFNLCDNNAVAYYVYLVQIQEFFQLYEDINHIPKNSWKLLLDQVEKTPKHLIDHSELDTFFKDIRVIVDNTYTRAVKYLQPLLHQFQGFDNHTWVFASKLEYNQVHASFHALKKGGCDDQCQLLVQEVAKVNTVLPTLKWPLILQQFQVPVIETMLEILLPLPAFWEEVEGGTKLEEAELTIRTNLKLDWVDWIEERGEELEEAKNVIEAWKIPTLFD